MVDGINRSHSCKTDGISRRDRIEQWRKEYKDYRTHSSLDNPTLAKYALKI